MFKWLFKKIKTHQSYQVIKANIRTIPGEILIATGKLIYRDLDGNSIIKDFMNCVCFSTDLLEARGGLNLQNRFFDSIMAIPIFMIDYIEDHIIYTDTEGEYDGVVIKDMTMYQPCKHDLELKIKKHIDELANERITVDNIAYTFDKLVDLEIKTEFRDVELYSLVLKKIEE